MTRVPRAEAKARTRRRLIEQAERLFREQGYAATSLEAVAEAAEVTKGAIYGHFASKEDLLLCAVEAAPTPDHGELLNDTSRPPRERLAELGRRLALDEVTADDAGLAVGLELFAALLRNPEARLRYAADLRRRLEELVSTDADEPLPDIDPVEPWAIGHALYLGLRILCRLDPETFTEGVFEHAYELLAGLYSGPPGASP